MIAAGRAVVVVVVVSLVLVLLCSSCGYCLGDPSHLSHVQFQQLQGQVNGAAKIAHNPNGAVFLTFASNQEPNLESFSSSSFSSASDSDSNEKLQHFSLEFVQQFHALWGFSSAQLVHEQLFVVGTDKDNQIPGISHVLMEQRFEGVRVFGGKLKAHFTRDGKLSAMNGLIVSGINENSIPSVEPEISFEDASAIAIKAVTAKLQAGRPQISQDVIRQLAVKPVSASSLLIFRKDVLSPMFRSANPYLVWEIQVFAPDHPLLEQVMVDTQSKMVVNHISMIQNSLHRRVFNGVYHSSSMVWDEGNDLPTDNPEMVKVLNGSEVFYDLFSRTFDYLSFDGKDGMIESVYNISGNSCPNAWWDGEKISYCREVISLDVAVHELTHGVTSYTDNLYYQFQSGALNEAYSDIFGETADILAGDPLKQVLRTTGNCSSLGEGTPANDNSTRWLIGEDIPYHVFQSHAIRDMWRPECYSNDPGAVTKGSYWCLVTDNGGVHINSGIINHAYALVVDGGDFGGQSLTGIGFNKALAVWWRAKRHYQSETSNFVDHANALHQSCADLVGKTVRDLQTGHPAETITTADCDEISKAIVAVNMTADVTQICDFVSFGKDITDPDSCPSGANGSVFYSTDFQSVAGWTHKSIDPTQSSLEVYWSWVANNDSSILGLLAPSEAYSYCPSLQALNELISPKITAPSDGTVILSFRFFIETAFTKNGGSAAVIVNGQERKFKDADFLYNGYNGVVSNSQNQLDEAQVWTGYTGSSLADLIYHMDNHLYQTRIKITGIHEGDVLELKFSSSEDLCYGPVGFFITDVNLAMCDSHDEGSESDNLSAASTSLPSAVFMLIVAAALAFFVL